MQGTRHWILQISPQQLENSQCQPRRPVCSLSCPRTHLHFPFQGHCCAELTPQHFGGHSNFPGLSKEGNLLLAVSAAVKQVGHPLPNPWPLPTVFQLPRSSSRLRHPRSVRPMGTADAARLISLRTPLRTDKLTAVCSPASGLTCRGGSHFPVTCPKAGRRWDLPPLAHAPVSPWLPARRVLLSLQGAGPGERSHLAAPTCG